MINDEQMLNHIYQNTQIGRESIVSVLRHAEEADFRRTLQQQLTEYDRIYQQAENLLRAQGKTPEKIDPLLKLNAQLTGALKAGVNDSPSHIAEMMIQGTTKGMTKSIRQLNDYEEKDGEVRALAEQLLATEKSNIEQMKSFL